MDAASDVVGIVGKSVLGEREVSVKYKVTMVSLTVLGVEVALGLERVAVDLAGNNGELVRLVRTCVVL